MLVRFTTDLSISICLSRALSSNCSLASCLYLPAYVCICLPTSVAYLLTYFCIYLSMSISTHLSTSLCPYLPTYIHVDLPLSISTYLFL